MGSHKHTWIDITYLQSRFQHRMCTKCNLEQRRLIDLAPDDPEQPWKTVSKSPLAPNTN